MPLSVRPVPMFWPLLAILMTTGFGLEREQQSKLISVDVDARGGAQKRMETFDKKEHAGPPGDRRDYMISMAVSHNSSIREGSMAQEEQTMAWTLHSGSCSISGQCVQSPNYPGNYGNHEHCSFSASSTSPLSVQAFSTESGYDYLTVNGHQYGGSSGPAGVIPTQPITWFSDGSIVKSGWRICQDTQEQGTCADGSPNPNYDTCLGYTTRMTCWSRRRSSTSCCDVAKTQAVRRRNYAGDAYDNCKATCGICQTTSTTSTTTTATTIDIGTCDGTIDVSMSWIADNLKHVCNDETSFYIASNFNWGSQTVKLNDARRRSDSCFHPAASHSYYEGTTLKFRSWYGGKEEDVCNCYKRFVERCGEMGSYECMMENVCHCQNVCPDFKGCLGCTNSLIEADEGEKGNNSAPKMTRTATSSQNASGGAWSSLMARWTKTNPEPAREDSVSLDQTTDGKCA